VAWEGSLADGNFLWPITVAGPRPIYTALPHFPSLQIVDFSVRPAPERVNESD